MNDVTIRAASGEDLEAVQDLLRAAQLPVDGVADFFPACYAVMQRGAEIVAAIGVECYGAHGLLRSAVVADAFRGTGLGGELTRERLAWSRRQGLQDVYLLTTTAAPFLARLGFEAVDRGAVPAEIATAPEFAYICPSAAVVMRIGVT